MPKPKLIILAPFTLPTTTDKALVLEKGQEWGHKIGQVFPSQQQREALDILGCLKQISPTEVRGGDCYVEL
ncbi:MAG: hypothetical protein DRR08_27460 [Candidatus Parabeggiatoa sp. nov. 2]|nr:MAG: hypothetical protein B6247_30385 [Beggiatoa sp. 4572_84]RKZ53310.1 MAG: hypothetical protein DRR08_27460 [Gammaproteobacteria bacterium]